MTDKTFTLPDQYILNAIPDPPENDTFKTRRINTFYKSNLAKSLPNVVDMRKMWGPCYDQGSIGSCVSNSCIGAIRYLSRKMNLGSFEGSRLFNYYNSRALYFDIQKDTGSHSSAAYEAVRIFGLCKETSWPYDVNKFTIKPSEPAFNEADLVSMSYLNINKDNLSDIKQCLADGFPITFCLTLFENWSAVNGQVPEPTGVSKGGHAMNIIGYDDTKQMFIIANSWNKWGGMDGFLYISYKYVQKHAWDLKTPRLFGKIPPPNPRSNRTDTVSLFSGVDYQEKEVELTKGDFPDISRTTMKLNDVGSVRVPSGFTVTLFSGLNFTGNSITINKNTRWLGKNANDKYQFNDKTCSVKITNQQPTPITPPKPISEPLNATNGINLGNGYILYSKPDGIYKKDKLNTEVKLF